MLRSVERIPGPGVGSLLQVRHEQHAFTTLAQMNCRFI